ncbi:gibberellin 3-beta-dioxygenase 1-like [Apium graveolens]|uniref:gibberellin 3-beta-dioxygenase 1-like n=1 Tax=Apium graveolens TaxID=4045 RepID=UPI003D7B282A
MARAQPGSRGYQAQLMDQDPLTQCNQVERPRLRSNPGPGSSPSQDPNHDLDHLLARVLTSTCALHNPPRRGTWARDDDNYQQLTYQTNTARVRVLLGHPEGGPRLDMCMQSTQARRPPPPTTNGPHLEIMSNGKYKSVYHRTTVNKDKTRMSWPSVILKPPPELLTGPILKLITQENPAKFNTEKYKDYICLLEAE